LRGFSAEGVDSEETAETVVGLAFGFSLLSLFGLAPLTFCETRLVACAGHQHHLMT